MSALFNFPCCFSAINFYCPWRAWRLSPWPLLVGHFLGRLMVFQRRSIWCFQSCPSLKLESRAEIPVDEIMALLSHHTASPRPQSSSAGVTSHKIHWSKFPFLTLTSLLSSSSKVKGDAETGDTFRTSLAPLFLFHSLLPFHLSTLSSSHSFNGYLFHSCYM